MSGLDDLLARPPDQRRREYQYRFAQSVVFGLPVLALQFYGRSLGGPEADRWVALLQALLAGWVVYVGAAGMLFESLLLLARRRFAADLVPAVAAAGFYLVGLARSAPFLFNPTPLHPIRPTFHWAVAVVVAWSGWRWWRMSGGRRPGK